MLPRRNVSDGEDIRMILTHLGPETCAGRDVLDPGGHACVPWQEPDPLQTVFLRPHSDAVCASSFSHRTFPSCRSSGAEM